MWNTHLAHGISVPIVYAEWSLVFQSFATSSLRLKTTLIIITIPSFRLFIRMFSLAVPMCEISYVGYTEIIDILYKFDYKIGYCSQSWQSNFLCVVFLSVTCILIFFSRHLLFKPIVVLHCFRGKTCCTKLTKYLGLRSCCQSVSRYKIQLLWEIFFKIVTWLDTINLR